MSSFQEKSSENNEKLSSSAMLTEMAGEFRRHALEQVSEPSTKEELVTDTEKKCKQLKENWKNTGTNCREYDCHLEMLQEQNSLFQTDKDATFMRNEGRCHAQQVRRSPVTTFKSVPKPVHHRFCTLPEPMLDTLTWFLSAIFFSNRIRTGWPIQWLLIPDIARRKLPFACPKTVWKPT